MGAKSCRRFKRDGATSVAVPRRSLLALLALAVALAGHPAAATPAASPEDPQGVTPRESVAKPPAQPTATAPPSAEQMSPSPPSATKLYTPRTAWPPPRVPGGTGTLDPPEPIGPPTSHEAAILAAYPNPVRDGDAGEFVVVRLPPGGGNWSVADDDGSVRLSRTAGGIVAVTADPERVRPLVPYPVVEVVDDLALANGEDVVRLRRDGEVIDEVAYDSAPEGELYRPGVGWEPLGATDFRATASGPATVEPFVLPDAPDVPVRTLENAEDRILLAGYTLTDRRVRRALADAAERDVAVRVLVDGTPVGGLSRREATTLDALVDAGAEVRAVGGPRDRYSYHHPKYAVVDDRAVVLSENWKPSGTGGRSSRGWGVVVDADATAAQLTRVFRADAGWRDAIPWSEFRQGKTFQEAAPTEGNYPARIDPRTVRAESVRVLVAPDNVEREVLALLESADERVAVQQVSIGGRDQPFLRAAVDAARRGVEVRVLLSSAWYVQEDNARLARWLNDRAAAEDLPLEAKLADPRGRFEKIHNKGVVVDGERALVGSVNWNNNSVRENREVALVLEGEAVAGYYERVFRADWQGGRWPAPIGLAVAVLVAAVLAAAFGYRRFSFEE